ncbi:MAG: coaX [Bacteroidota bacterium]|nr:coaX [Bacteroidota bacterium]
MNLSIDIGNTQIKFGLFIKDELKEVLQGGDIEQLLDKCKIKNAIISKTGSNDEIEYKLKQRKINTLFLSQSLKLPIKIEYKTPETLGADRIAGSVGAKSLFPENNVLKIDFGTCITYDFINKENQYPGGAISPGMMMRFKALHNYTAKLPLIDPMQFASFELTGTDTATSILSGVINGIKEEATGIINQYETRFGSLKVVATGGDAGLFVTLLKSEIFARPYLVLEGLNRILNYNL